MSSITFQNLKFHYQSPHVQIFDSVLLRLDTTWKCAFLGRNGRGKTTLLKLINRDIEPIGGSLDVPVGTSYFPYIPENEDQKTFEIIKDCVAPFSAWEEQMEKLARFQDDEHVRQYSDLAEKFEMAGGYEIEAQIHREMARMGLSESLLDQKFSALSGGEQTRVLIISLFLKKGHFLLLDEPTNHLDLNGRIALAEYLSKKQGFIIASHDRYIVNACADHVLSIERSGVNLIQGNYTEWKKQKNLKDDFERRQNEKLSKEIKSMKKAAVQRRTGADKREKDKIGGGAAKGHIGHMAAKQMKRALSIERRLDKNVADKESLFKDYEKDRQLKFHTDKKSSGQLLSINDVTLGYGDKKVVSNFSLNVQRGMRICITGNNGSGKTTLFNAIAGQLTPWSGSISRPGNVTMTRSFQMPVWHKGLLKQCLAESAIDETRFRQILGVFGVEGEIFDRPLETFSQGQLKKVDLCRSFVASADLFLWDEPINYIDVMSREQIEDVILKYEPTLLFVEHDKYFVDKIATQIVEIS